MATYLLLRNNKESGPYSLDDLMNMGLKAYDLVWVQGRSAAWRYPSEVEELKPFAPVVEEQPFDRFYKKQPDTKKEEAPRQKEEVPKQEASVIAPEHEKYIPKKSVFVTMPGQKNVFAQTIKKEEPVPVPEPIQQTIVVSENPAAAQIKYSQPLDEIKEMYVKTLQDRKQKIARKGFWLQNLKKAAVVLLFVAIGLIAGFIIKSNGNKQEGVAEKTAASSQSAKNESPAATPNNTPVTTQDTAQNLPSLHPPTGGYVNKEPEQQKHESLLFKEKIDGPVLPDIKKEDTKKEKLATPSQIDPVAQQGVDINPATGERNRKVRTGNSLTNNSNNNISSDPKNSVSSDIANQVSVTSNEYKKVAFGGIRNLELTVTNDSKYVLDNVTVELQYLKPNELPLRTENVQFKSVAPKASSTVRIPDTNRGIKVVYRIINIKSRQMDEVASGH
jgi:hypothetical protein